MRRRVLPEHRGQTGFKVFQGLLGLLVLRAVKEDLDRKVQLDLLAPKVQQAHKGRRELKGVLELREALELKGVLELREALELREVLELREALGLREAKDNKAHKAHKVAEPKEPKARSGLQGPMVTKV
jgi:hypothetical protein